MGMQASLWILYYCVVTSGTMNVGGGQENNNFGFPHKYQLLDHAKLEQNVNRKWRG